MQKWLTTVTKEIYCDDVYVTRPFEHPYGCESMTNLCAAIRPTFLDHFWTYLCIIMCSEMNSSLKRFLRWSKGVSRSCRRVATLGRPLPKWSFRLPVVSIRRLRRDKVDCETWNRSGTEIWSLPLKAVRSDCKQFFSVLKKTELDYDTSISMRLWNVKNVVSAVLSTIIRYKLMH
jgi:hypothetical protein